MNMHLVTQTNKQPSPKKIILIRNQTSSREHLSPWTTRKTTENMWTESKWKFLWFNKKKCIQILHSQIMCTQRYKKKYTNKNMSWMSERSEQIYDFFLYINKSKQTNSIRNDGFRWFSFSFPSKLFSYMFINKQEQKFLTNYAGDS